MQHYRSKNNDLLAITIIFFLFFLFGIVITILWQNWYGNQVEILSGGAMEEIANMTWNYKILFYQCLLKRVSVVIIIPLITLTGIGLWAIRLYTAWFSFSMGALMEALTLQYGISGLLLFVVGIFPHYFFYIPAYILLFRVCYLINSDMRQGRKYDPRGRVKSNLEKVKALCIILGVVIIGTIFESYVNPYLLRYFSKLFF